MTEYSNCPNPECGAAWGIEEMSFQECDSCGYPSYYEDDDIETQYEDDDILDDDGIVDIYDEPF